MRRHGDLANGPSSGPFWRFRGCLRDDRPRLCARSAVQRRRVQTGSRRSQRQAAALLGRLLAVRRSARQEEGARPHHDGIEPNAVPARERRFGRIVRAAAARAQAATAGSHSASWSTRSGSATSGGGNGLDHPCSFNSVALPPHLTEWRLGARALPQLSARRWSVARAPGRGRRGGRSRAGCSRRGSAGPRGKRSGH
jgi:hypothetical protein